MRLNAASTSGHGLPTRLLSAWSVTVPSTACLKRRWPGCLACTSQRLRGWRPASTSHRSRCCPGCHRYSVKTSALTSRPTGWSCALLRASPDIPVGTPCRREIRWCAVAAAAVRCRVMVPFPRGVWVVLLRRGGRAGQDRGGLPADAGVFSGTSSPWASLAPGPDLEGSRTVASSTPVRISVPDRGPRAARRLVRAGDGGEPR